MELMTAFCMEYQAFNAAFGFGLGNMPDDYFLQIFFVHAIPDHPIAEVIKSFVNTGNVQVTE